ncbi:MAG: UDP-N-acetylmuramoyl-L-alanyl-D-glutamate--2,6-diaminopimelate ligase [Vicinamibacterales bacterium]
MKLGDLIAALSALLPLQSPVLRADAAARRVEAVEYDSRLVVQGAVFVAVKGQRHDATAFVTQAVGRGAIAIVSESPAPPGFDVPWFIVADARLALAAAAAVYYQRPSDELAVVGITGTNGKTTTSYLLGHIFETAGWPCGRIGTVGYRIGDTERAAARTTPEAPDVQRLLRDMVTHGSRACVMEVSSHALALHRVDFIAFAAGIFTNLTRDHLDFHDGMEEYFLAKRRLFEMLPTDAPAIVNVDDPYGSRLATQFPRALTYALDRPAAVSPRSLSSSIEGVAFDAQTPRGVVRLKSALLGRPNAYNLLAAAATAIALDLPIEAIETGVATLEHVPGRWQRVSSPTDDVTVLVDYAHTDDALKNLLETARPLTRGRLVTVFGCGGDRDRTKRPLMGAVAARLSDAVVLTSDNPRSEDPATIIEEIKKGLVPPDRFPSRGGQAVTPVKVTPWTAIVDRHAAIATAIAQADAGDLIVIAGKGHEKYQEIGGKSLPFDDVAVARQALNRRAGGKGGAS